MMNAITKQQEYLLTGTKKDWKEELSHVVMKYHLIGAWITVFFNPIWTYSDYLMIPNRFLEFMSIRLSVSIITVLAILFRKKLKISPELLIFIPFLGITLQSAYIHSQVELIHFAKKIYGYNILYIGAGMVILWRPIYSFVVISMSILAHIFTIYFFASFTLNDALINGGLLSITIGFFSIFLIYTRNKLIVSNTKAKVDLENSQQETIKQKNLVELKNTEIMESITYAKRIQEAVLPSTSIMSDYFKNSFILYLPKDVVSGDFYWVANVDNKLIFAAADCTGHGVPGAFLSLIGNQLLNKIVIDNKITQPDKVLDYLKKGVVQTLQQNTDGEERKEGMDIALCVIDKENQTLEYAGAYNPCYIVRNNKLQEYKADRMPVGVYFKKQGNPFQLNTIQLRPDDTLYIFTDGFADQFGGPKNKKYKYRPFRQFLMHIHERPMNEQRDALVTEFNNWRKDNEQVDDVLIIGVKI